MRPLSMFRRSLSCIALAVSVSSPVAAQFTLEARQGTTWSDKLTLSELSTMTFRWKWVGRTGLSGAEWQMMFDNPAVRGTQIIVKSMQVPLPNEQLSEYATFQIAPDVIPSSAPSTFYVRIRSGTNYSSWLPVTVQSTARTSPVSIIDALAPQPLITAGVPNPNPPLWIKLTKIICYIETEDRSESDEVYAIAGSVLLNHAEPWKSTVWANVTTLYDGIDNNDFRVPNLALWGPPSGDAAVLSKPGDAYIMMILLEHDSGNLQLMRTMLFGQLAATVQTLNPDMSYTDISSRLTTKFYDVVNATNSGSSFSSDEKIGAVFPRFTQDELDAARDGKIVKKEILIDNGGGKGVYYVRFQMGRAGTSPEPW